jgi:hypothetical protein
MKIDNGLTIKQNIIGLVGIMGLFLVVYLWAVQPTAEAKENYIAKAPVAQAELDTFEAEVLKDRCVLVKRLATLKLEDDMNGVPTNSDRNDLAAKRDMNCSF